MSVVGQIIMSALAAIVLTFIAYLLHRRNEAKERKEKRIAYWPKVLNKVSYAYSVLYLNKLVEEASQWDGCPVGLILGRHSEIIKKYGHDIHGRAITIGFRFYDNLVEMRSSLINHDFDRFNEFREKAITLLREVEYIRVNKTLPEEQLNGSNVSTGGRG